METKQKKTKVVLSMLALAGLLVFSLFAVGGSLEPSAPPGPTMKTLDEVEPRKPIGQADIPLTITESGSYYLTCDVNSAGTAITVEANNVTIDLMGYQLIGPGSGTNYGIHITGQTNVEIRNGTIRQFGSRGIYEDNPNSGKRHRVIGIRAMSTGSWAGIQLRGSAHLVKECTAANNGSYGIYTDNTSTVTGNIAHSNQIQGIYAGSGSIVTGNIAFGNIQNGGIYTGQGCTVTGNTAISNPYGIVAGPQSTVSGNSVYNNQKTGLYCNGSCTITGNTAGYNNRNNSAGEAGIWVDTDCLLKSNTANWNNQNNIFVNGARNAIEENLVTGSTNGINFNSTGNFYANNRASTNTSNYTNTAGNTDGGGNYSF